jgi:hypothetical protein
MLTGCSSFCGNSLVSVHPSPDGSFVAVVFYRNCGATTPFTTEISVVRGVEDAISRGYDGNVFSMVDPNDSNKGLEVNGAIEARLNWRSSQLLSISIPRRARIGKQVHRIRNIEIQYIYFD